MRNAPEQKEQAKKASPANFRVNWKTCFPTASKHFAGCQASLASGCIFDGLVAGRLSSQHFTRRMADIATRGKHTSSLLGWWFLRRRRSCLKTGEVAWQQKMATINLICPYYIHRHLWKSVPISTTSCWLQWLILKKDGIPKISALVLRLSKKTIDWPQMATVIQSTPSWNIKRARTPTNIR